MIKRLNVGFREKNSNRKVGKIIHVQKIVHRPQTATIFSRQREKQALKQTYVFIDRIPQESQAGNHFKCEKKIQQTVLRYSILNKGVTASFHSVGQVLPKLKWK